MTKREALSRYFGYTDFRKGQEEIIDNILQGRDVLAVMPTGAGKSLCFQIPALMMEGTAIVISPLISLMKDQIAALKENGISAVTVNSSTVAREYPKIYAKAYAGEYKLIYVSPERLDSESFVRLICDMDISMVCIDEAHCVSQWGQDFRSSYLKIRDFISGLTKRPVVTAFTATATDVVREDIVRLLGLREPMLTVTGFDRENLYFEVQKPEDKLLAVRKYLDSHIDNSGIIYCSTRRAVEELSSALRLLGYSVTRYHAGLDAEERRENQDAFVRDYRKVMVATNAFGMGIDKSNVSFVIHYNMPGDIESYYQEAGRAGRDGEPAECILLFDNSDIRTQKYFINHPSDNEKLTPEETTRLKERRTQMLQAMTSYATGRVCLRKKMLNYFGERAEPGCGNCSVCCGERQYTDITVAAQKILSAVARTKELLPVCSLIDFLKGDERVNEACEGISRIKTFGIMESLTKEQIRDLVEYLIKENILASENGEGTATVRLNEISQEILFSGRRVRRRIDDTAKAAGRKAVGRAEAAGQEDIQLFAMLKALRKAVAEKRAIPAFVVFSDASLKEMSIKAPVSLEEFRQISGVGAEKLEKYGPVFIKAIKLYKEKSAK